MGATPHRATERSPMAANTLYEMKNRLSLTWALAVGVLLLAHPLTGREKLGLSTIVVEFDLGR